MSNWKSDVRAAIDAERKAAQQRRTFVDALCKEICAAPPVAKSMKMLSSEPTIFAISFSDLSASGCINLTPEYYSQKKQSQMVESVLRTAATTSRVIERISKLAEEKVVVINKTRFALNPSTCKVLTDTLAEAAV